MKNVGRRSPGVRADSVMRFTRGTSQRRAQMEDGFAGFAGAEEDAGAWYQGHRGVRGLFAAVFRHRKELDLSHPFVSLAKFEVRRG